ncbi:MAG: YtxH domain-containing protein [Zoogloeaceae bacterium]|jgi:hypothetical protein|nr:YtxH domain-containing protein [Zoogloeaceae bacterium]
MSKKSKEKKAQKAARKAAKQEFNRFFTPNGAQNTATSSLFGPLGQWLREHPSEQFLIGALLGAATAYALSNEELRAKLLKGGIELYGRVVGGLAELREQMADLRAEAETKTL